MALFLVVFVLLSSALHSSRAGIQHRGSSNGLRQDFSGSSRVLPLEPHPHNSAKNDKDADFIIGNAKKLSKYQDESHPLSIHSFTAFPIVTDFFPDTKQTHPLLAGGRLGKGKIIGGTDPDFFKVFDSKFKDDEMVLLNALRWLSKTSAPKKVGLNDPGQYLLESFLEANGIETATISLPHLESAAQLADFDVILLQFRTYEAEKEMLNLHIISEYVQSGGGVMALASSWYRLVSPFPENYPLNKLSAPAGFVWSQQPTEGQPQKSDYYTLSKGTPSKTKTAVDVARSLMGKKCSVELNDTDSTLLSYVYAMTPMGISVYPGTSLERTVQNIALMGQPLPSETKPVAPTPYNVCRTKRFHKMMATWFSKHPESVIAHPAAKVYPGVAVSTKTNPFRADYFNVSLEPLKYFKDFAGVQLDLKNCMYGGSKSTTKASQATNKYSNYWLSTGRYLNAGAVGQITILNRNDNFDQLEVLVGAHTDSLHAETKWSRLPEISMTYKFVGGVAKFSSPYGGLVYIEVPSFLSIQDLDVSKLQLSFQGDFVQAPVFDSDSMDNEAWKAVRNNPAPWAEIGNNRIKFIVPSSKARTLDDPVGLMKFWNEAMDAYSDLLSLPKVLHRPQRILEDIQVAYDAYMHAGDPIVIPPNEGSNALSVEKMKEPKGEDGGAPCWGHFHELGHNFQDDEFWSPEGAADITNNIMSIYMCEHISGVPPEQAHEHSTSKVYKEDVAEFIKGGKKNWMEGFWPGLQFYMYLQRTYGWEFYKKFFATFAENKFEKPKDEVVMMGLTMEVMSTAAGKNLIDYFDSWNIKVSKEAREKVTKMGLPLSGLKVEDILTKK